MTSIILSILCPKASLTISKPPTLGFNKWTYGGFSVSCLEGVKRVPSTKFNTDVGRSRKPLQAFKVAFLSSSRR